MEDGSVGLRRLAPQEVRAKAMLKAKERENLFKERQNQLKERQNLMKERQNLMAKLADRKKEQEAKLADAKKKKLLAELDRLCDRRNGTLLQPKLTWEQKVMAILGMVRCRQLTEYNHKMGYDAHTCGLCCVHNIAFFDLDKESKGVPWKPIDKIPSPHRLDDSVNVIAIKVVESDRDYPISVFGTVLARDEYDYRRVYLFKRGRDDPQVITSKDDTLTLMGPYRALAASDSMSFEFHLKVKGDGDVDEDFSKGVIVHDAVCHTKRPTTKDLHSCLSKVELVYTPVERAVEASFAVSILKGPYDFIRKVTAWTTGDEENKIVVYKEVAGVGRGGSVVDGLVVAVPEDEELVLRVCVFEHCEHEEGKCFQLTLGHGINEWIAGQEPYELKVKISWRGVMNRRGPGSRGRPNMWCHLGGNFLLL